MSEFRDSAPSAPAVFYRSYSRRKPNGERESFSEAVTRAVNDLADIGGLTQEQRDLCLEMGLKQYTLPSGRALWVAGTDWAKKQDNFPGYYNCCSLQVEHLGIFSLLMELAMMGVGTGAVLEKEVVDKLPPVSRQVEIIEVIENSKKQGGRAATKLEIEDYIFDNIPVINLVVGDSRQGWASGFQALIDLACGTLTDVEKDINCNRAFVKLDLSQIRQAGERLKGFGGVANPVRLRATFENVAEILAGAYGRSLTPIECCLLIDEAASAVVAGNVRRCLPEDALVHTSNGLVPIKDVQIGDMVQTPVGFRRVTNKFDQGIQDVYELETNGPKPRATLNHRIATLADARGGINWVKVQDLEEGHRLMHSTEVLPGGQTSLPDDFTANRPINSRTAKVITIPPLNSEVAWLIGFTHGDGYIAVGRNRHDKPFGSVRWATNASKEEESLRIHQKICSALSLFGVGCTRSLIKGENTAVTTCTSIRLAEYFLEYIKKPNEPIEIPSFILRGGSDIRAAYLAGVMDSDGSADNRPPHLVTTVYPKFARQVAAVASSLGIVCRTSMTAPQNDSWRVRHHVTIPALKSLYNTLVAPHSVKGKIKEGLKMYGFTVPGEIMRETYSYSEMHSMGFGGTKTIPSNYERYAAESDVDMDVPVTFKGLGSYDSIQTYDIEVEEAHCFYCDGYLTHNSAGMKQFSWDDQEAAVAKEGLYKQNEDGSWSVDPKKEALRMSNHTRCYHHKPSYEEIEDAVTKQYYSGEGAIQYVPEMVARANADLLDTQIKKDLFLSAYIGGGKAEAKEYLRLLAEKAGEPTDEKIIDHRITRYGLNPCGEIALRDNLCNLSEVNVNIIDPHDLDTQQKAFYAAGLQVASLLQHKFVPPELAYSREVDPIVGVGLTGGFDFFVHLFGADWLGWMMEGRPANEKHELYTKKERFYLSLWRKAAEAGVHDYCRQAGIRVPNRCTDLQPSGSKSLLTGASPGWHPPKAQRFIRRITFGKHDPLVAALRDYGYSVIPAQSARDEEGNLLDDVNDPRVQEVLVEIPTEVSWANLPGCDQFDLAKLPIEAQWGFYMQFQNYYTTHNTSATLEFREHEIPLLSKLIYDNIQEDGGYISAALLARFDANETFPRLPFEPIDKQTYDRKMAQIKAYRVTLSPETTILDLLRPYDNHDHILEPQDTACASAACLAKVEKDEAKGLL